VSRDNSPDPGESPLANDTIRETALRVARETLERRWPADRFELELESEREARWSHVFDRSHYAATFHVFELADTARVSLDASGAIRAVRFPVDAREADEGKPVSSEPPAPHLATARTAAEEVARGSGRWRTLRSRVVKLIAGEGGAGSIDAIVRLFALAPEGPMTLDLDATSGERIAFFVPALLRGSKGGRPLSRREVALRIQGEGVLPREVELERADLEDAGGARLWRLRFHASGLDQCGQAVVCAHARTGVIAGLTASFRARVRLGRTVSHERAASLIEKALPLLLGPDSRLAVIIQGAIVGRGKPRAGWVGTALTGEGEVARVALAGDEVETSFGGKLQRARVGPERAVLVNEARRRRSATTLTHEPLHEE